jgi:DNA invertase Pin-like site-specific DNA recombinase
VTKPITAGIYCRLSLARDGDTTKVDEQERICRELLRQRGWEPVTGCGYPDPNGVYTDNSKSAWKKNTKRPAWDQMLTDVDAGKLAAIVVYHGDRLVRQPFDLNHLIKLADGRGLRIASPTGDRDLDNHDDRFVLRILTDVACKESDDTSRRMKTGHARRRRAGIVTTGGRGGRLFGFEKDGVTHVPKEAAIVREVTAAILAGNSVRHIAAGLAARGVTTTAGKPMHPLAIRRMLANPRYAGLMPGGTSAAAWDALLDRGEWEAATALLAANGGMLPAGHNARKYLLSGLAVCGVCGRGLQVLPAHTARWTAKPVHVAARYGCLRDGCRKVFRDLALLDGYVSARVVERLNNPASPPGRLPDTPGLAAELRALAEEREQVEAAIADHTKGRLPLLLARLDSLDARLADIRELAGAGAQARVLGRHAGLSLDEFAGLELGVRRALVSGCYKVVVLPASARGPGFRTEDVRLEPR